MVKNVKMLFLFILVVVMPVVTKAQTDLPSWTKSDYRKHAYPDNEWFTGFVFDKIGLDANAGGVRRDLENLESSARAKLLENIIVVTSVSTDLRDVSVKKSKNDGNISEDLTTMFERVVQGRTGEIKIPNMKVDSYHNQSTGEIYAFAAVKRADLANFYRTQIDLELNNAERAAATAEQLELGAKYIDARYEIEKAKKMLDDVAILHNLLVAVGANESGLTARINKLQESILAIGNLKPIVYVDCQYKGGRNDAFGRNPGIPCNIIEQALSDKNDFSFTTNKGDAADYDLTIVTSTTQRAGARGGLEIFANVTGSVHNRLTKLKTAELSIVDDSRTREVSLSPTVNPELLATRAFNRPALKDKVLEAILQSMKD